MKAVTNFRKTQHPEIISGWFYQPAMPVSRFAHGVVWIPNICEAIHFEGAGLGGGGANPQAPAVQRYPER